MTRGTRAGSRGRGPWQLKAGESLITLGKAGSQEAFAAVCPDFHGARAPAGSTPDNVPTGSFKPAHQLGDAVTSAEA